MWKTEIQYKLLLIANSYAWPYGIGMSHLGNFSQGHCGIRVFIRAFNTIPFTAIVILVYALAVFASGVDGFADTLETGLLKVAMVSGDTLTITLEDVFILFVIFGLFIEIVKATSTKEDSIANHGFSTVVMIVSLVLFLVAPGFSTSAFFFVFISTIIDVIAGYTITIITARRDIGLPAGG